MQANQKTVIWTVVIASVVLLVAMFLMVNSAKNAIPETPVVPTAAEVAALINVPASGDIPTADEIADAISDKVDLDVLTGPMVEDTKKGTAYNLAIEEMDDDDFREAVMDEINSEIGDGYRYIDDEDDMAFVVKDLDEDETEVDLLSGERARVTLEFKVYFLEDGEDDECNKARLQVKFMIDDLDRDNDYEDAEVDYYYDLNVETLSEPRSSYCDYI